MIHVSLTHSYYSCITHSYYSCVTQSYSYQQSLISLLFKPFHKHTRTNTLVQTQRNTQRKPNATHCTSRTRRTIVFNTKPFVIWVEFISIVYIEEWSVRNSVSEENEKIRSVIDLRNAWSKVWIECLRRRTNLRV